MKRRQFIHAATIATLAASVTESLIAADVTAFGCAHSTSESPKSGLATSHRSPKPVRPGFPSLTAELGQTARAHRSVRPDARTTAVRSRLNAATCRHLKCSGRFPGLRSVIFPSALKRIDLSRSVDVSKSTDAVIGERQFRALDDLNPLNDAFFTLSQQKRCGRAFHRSYSPRPHFHHSLIGIKPVRWSVGRCRA